MVSEVQSNNSAQETQVAAQAGDSGETVASPDTDRMQRAEQLASNITETVARATAVTGQKLRYLVARAGEIAADFWAEVQDIRRGK